jgi:PAS domain S-box-containing protein
MEQWRKLLSVDPSLSAPNQPVQHDEKFAALTSISDDILALFETSRGCSYLSPNWERLTGRSAEKSLGGRFYASLHPDHVKPFIATLQQALSDDRTQLSLYPQQFLFINADGGHRWYSLHIADVKDMAGGQQQLVCGLKDAQEMMDAHRSVKEARRETQIALQARSEFLNAMSHELRTPLNAILGFTQIMENGMYGDITNPQYREYLRHIRESGYELLAQIDEVMEMATVDTGGAQLHRDVCDLKDVVLHALSMHRAQAKTSGVALNCSVAQGFAEISIDRVKMQHCISHIVANSVQFSKPGAEVTVSAEFNENRELCIFITDTGMGMSARKLHGLVAALQKEDSWAARNTNGLGLGLALAKEYSRLHDGYLTLESKAGLGTRVSIHLPAECVVTKPEKILQYAAFLS